MKTSPNIKCMDLAGDWTFKLDPQDQGAAAGWPTTKLPDKITLPGTTDEAGYGEKSTSPEIGRLTRVVKYYGAAWYQRDIVIPDAWRNQVVELFLERVIWESRVWVDGRPCDSQESLNTPHLHRLGRLTMGRHTLTIRIDNRALYPISVSGHCYTEETQTIWNGVVGRIELRARPLVRIEQIRSFPSASQKKVEAETTLQSDAAGTSAVTLRLRLRGPGRHGVVATADVRYEIPPGQTVVRPVVTLSGAPELWDEFTPRLYTLEVTLNACDTVRQTLGFREVSCAGGHVTINGRSIFLRGNLDAALFPKTGYPAMDVAGWRRILKIYQAHGLNHVRCHSWSPPEAAFTAADEIGFYFQCEVIWTQRHLGNDQPGGRKEVALSGSLPESVLNPPGIVDEYVRAEMRRILDTYGNHPSFILFALGNEFGCYEPPCGDWIAAEKRHDPRRLYSVCTTGLTVPQEEYKVTNMILPTDGLRPGVSCRDRVEPFNDWDFEKAHRTTRLPIIAHEVGQWCIHPTWDEIKKYTGVLRAANLETFRAAAAASGLVSEARNFGAASGALALRLYKDQIESHLRTPSCAGFQLLGMQDFPGQGEALDGWLDSFYDSKGIVTPQRFRRWCAPTVPLARLPKYIYAPGDTLTARIDVAHYGAAALRGVKTDWCLRDEHRKIIAQGTFAPVPITPSTVTTVGVVKSPLAGCAAPCRVRLEVRLRGTPFANDWDVWVLPANGATEPGVVVICDSLDSALLQLRLGKKVLLAAHRLGATDNASYAKFQPAYWSAAYFKGQHTLGGLVRKSHPALRKFPTDNHYDWQWEELCRNGRAFRLDGLPLAYQPIVQPIADFHLNWKLGSIFELRVGAKGSLLVCGYDVVDNLAKRPAARQLRESLLTYMNSAAFRPRTTANAGLLAKILPLPVSPQAVTKDTASPFVRFWRFSAIQTKTAPLAEISYPRPQQALRWKAHTFHTDVVDMHRLWWGKSGQNYFFTNVRAGEDMRVNFRMGYDGPIRVWVDGKEVFRDFDGTPPGVADKAVWPVTLRKGRHSITVAMDLKDGQSWGFMLRFGRQDPRRNKRCHGADLFPTVLQT